MRPKEFVSRHLLEPIPYLFADDLDLWISWKTQLADLLGVDPYEMVLVGSGAVGVSLNPEKNFRNFGEKSDVDVALISSHHFELAWRWLRKKRPRDLSLPYRQRAAIDAHRKNYIYWGCVATDRILSLLPFGKPWTRALESMATMEPTQDREINARIYRNFDALRGYHVAGIRRIRSHLAEPIYEEERIETEE